jgi:hypothetical protein
MVRSWRLVRGFALRNGLATTKADTLLRRPRKRRHKRCSRRSRAARSRLPPAKAIIDGELKRQAKWTEPIAVGDRAYIEAIEERVRRRQQLRVEEQSGIRTLQERYGSFSRPKNCATSSFEPSIPL